MDTLSQKYKLLFSLKNAVGKGYGFSMTVTRNETATQKTLFWISACPQFSLHLT